MSKEIKLYIEPIEDPNIYKYIRHIDSMLLHCADKIEIKVRT